MDATRYPIGIQSFRILRQERCAYADKTGYIYQLVKSASRTYFLSRPRRFGKSLFLSTLEAYFRGRKELFEGLAIYDLETEWRTYPVLRFDFSRAEAKTSEGLKEFIIQRLYEYEKEFDITDTSHIKAIGDRFGTLIAKIHDKTGSEVVVLIDEYDKGIHEVLDNAEQLDKNQDILRPFFSQIKAQGEYIRFCFITGVARFRHYTIFSGFNNPDDISMDSRYAAICGVTESELFACFKSGIKAFAEKLSMTEPDLVEMLRQRYDGYRFTASDTMVYNPFSIINCLSKQSMDNFWVTSGTPKVFVDYLSKSQFQLLELENLWVTKERMESTYSIEDPIPLLLQTGYLTIKEADEGLYKLGVPNGEVRNTLVNDLIPRYMGIHRDGLPIMLLNLRRRLKSADIDGFMSILQALVASIPYHELDTDNLERTYHLVIYELFLMIGIDARSEIAMSGGRIDMVAQTRDYVYVMEFKLGGTPDEALAQIDDKGYALPWNADGRKVYKIGVVFSPETRTICAYRAISN